jgi:hypothetical protein
MFTTDKRAKDIMYEHTRTEGWEMIIGSSLAYDKSIISLSTASLGFILAVSSTKDHITKCEPLFVLILTFLILTILISLLSFWFDQITGVSMQSQANRYYKGEKFNSKKGWSYYAGVCSKILSGLLFIVSIILFTIFFMTRS